MLSMPSQNSLSNTQFAQACKQKAMKCSEPVKLLCASMGKSVAVNCFSKRAAEAARNQSRLSAGVWQPGRQGCCL